MIKFLMLTFAVSLFSIAGMAQDEFVCIRVTNCGNGKGTNTLFLFDKAVSQIFICGPKSKVLSLIDNFISSNKVIVNRDCGLAFRPAASFYLKNHQIPPSTVKRADIDQNAITIVIPRAVEFLAVYQSRVIMQGTNGVPPRSETHFNENQQSPETLKQESCFEGSACLKASPKSASLEFSGCCEPFGCITFSTDGEIKYELQVPSITLRKSK